MVRAVLRTTIGSCGSLVNKQAGAVCPAGAGNENLEFMSMVAVDESESGLFGRARHIEWHRDK